VCLWPCVPVADPTLMCAGCRTRWQAELEAQVRQALVARATAVPSAAPGGPAGRAAAPAERALAEGDAGDGSREEGAPFMYEVVHQVRRVQVPGGVDKSQGGEVCGALRWGEVGLTAGARDPLAGL
jgi:hypothetical protein